MKHSSSFKAFDPESSLSIMDKTHVIEILNFGKPEAVTIHRGLELGWRRFQCELARLLEFPGAARYKEILLDMPLRQRSKHREELKEIAREGLKENFWRCWFIFRDHLEEWYSQGGNNTEQAMHFCKANERHVLSGVVYTAMARPGIKKGLRAYMISLIAALATNYDPADGTKNNFVYGVHGLLNDLRAEK